MCAVSLFSYIASTILYRVVLFSPVLHGAEAACRREGIALSFVAIGPAEPVMEQIRVHQPDAILCVGFFEPEILHAIRAAGKYAGADRYVS